MVIYQAFVKNKMKKASKIFYFFIFFHLTNNYGKSFKSVSKQKKKKNVLRFFFVVFISFHFNF